VTGTPVRPELLARDRSPAGRAAARRALGLDEGGRLVAVSGGSLGARSINRATVALAERWAGRSDTTLYHVVGDRDAAEMATLAPPHRPGGLRYRQVAFERRMELVYTAADIFVGRAGATTVAELAAVGLPSILVPLPGAPGDHQTANASRLQEAGAAIGVPDADVDAVRLDLELSVCLDDVEQLAAMGAAALTLARPHAAADVAALVIAYARV
jgi:UDP-N-acetylglucosamine--N-acetylmuramyl-(pentapeptide) pyrophosphoryl-undecaprenol N-acetylglucosamine transferase